MSQNILQGSRKAARRVAQSCASSSRHLKYGVRWSSSLERKWSTPLAKTLHETITTTGPVSIASYMRQCLTSDLGGYYTRRQEGTADQFGKTGDFVTSPEISQIFGELVGLWFYAEWIMQSKTLQNAKLLEKTHLIELGPGRGTLMSDMLRAIRRLPRMADAIEKIYLVEASQDLREAQAKLLCTPDPIRTHDVGFVGQCKMIPSAEIIWVEDASFLPKDSGCAQFIVAHEFFDALPIHAFTSLASKPSPAKRAGMIDPNTSARSSQQKEDKPGNQWHELMVNPTSPPSIFDAPAKDPNELRPEFELMNSPGPTYHSRILPSISERYKALLPVEGATIEVSPEARSITSALAQLVGPPPRQNSRPSPAGAALIIDYGPAETIPVNTLRGIQHHKLVSPFKSPGAVDVSADVDFGALVEAALEGSEDIEVHGPVSQGDFLKMLGGRERLDALLKRADDDEVKDALRKGWDRLVNMGPDGMGKVYKALAIVPFTDGKRRPIGFGGVLE